MKDPTQKFCEKIDINRSVAIQLFEMATEEKLKYRDFKKLLAFFEKKRGVSIPYFKAYYFVKRYKDYKS